MTSAAVEIAGVAKSFGDVVALDNIALTIHQNEFVSLLGPSGCGKTTLLRVIAGFETPTKGRVIVHGEDVTGVPPERRPTNIVFQRGALFPHMNVFENVAYSLKLRKWPAARIAAKVEEMLALVQLEKLGHRGPTELSGGQIQRVALARALAAEPRVLLLDEPLSALDLKLRQQMQLELRTIQRKLGATFLYVTHDQTEALVMSDRIAVMSKGRIIQEGTPREIYTRPASVFASAFIGETNLMQGTVVGAEASVVTFAAAGGTHVKANSSIPLKPGTRGTLSVRPEAVRVEVAASGNNTVDGMRGEVAEVVYLGNRIRIEVVTGDQVVIWADLRDEEAAGLDVGMPVILSWAPSAAQVWPDGSG